MSVGFTQEIGIDRVPCANQIHLALQKRFQSLLKGEKPISQISRARKIEFIKEIDVAASVIKVAADGGAKKLQSLQAVQAAQLGDLAATLLYERDHAVTIISSAFQLACAQGSVGTNRLDQSRRQADLSPSIDCR